MAGTAHSLEDRIRRMTPVAAPPEQQAQVAALRGCRVVPTMVGIYPMALAQKLSISVRPEELEWAKKRARSLGLSLSAVVSEALLRQRQAEAGVRLLEELGTDDITEEDLAAVRAELGWAPARKASPRRRGRRVRRGG